MFEFSPDAIVLADAAGRITDANPRALEMFGFSLEELAGQAVEVLVPRRFRERHPAHRDRYLADPHRRSMGLGLELYGQRKDGSEFPVDIMLTPVETSAGRIVLSVIRDVSEQRRAQEALLNAEARFHAIIESIGDYAIFMLDTGGNVVTWSQPAQRIKGYTPGEIIGRHFSVFYTPEDLAAGKPRRALHIAATQGRFEEECWRVRKDGSRFWAGVVIAAMHGSDGNLTGYTKVTRDFTDRKTLEESILLRLSNVLLSGPDLPRLLTAISAGIGIHAAGGRLRRRMGIHHPRASAARSARPRALSAGRRHSPAHGAAVQMFRRRSSARVGSRHRSVRHRRPSP